MPAERVSKSFKDISMTFESSPLNYDLIAIKNETAINRSILNLVFTLPGEKFFDDEFGSMVSKILFENINDITASLIEDQITNLIENYEPRVDLISVKSTPNYDEGAFDVKISYAIVGIDIPPQSLQFVLLPNR